MNQRKQGILLSYLNIILHAVIGFLYVPILLHYIGKSEYGLYQLMGSLIAYFGVMDFGLSATVIRFYAKYRAEGNTTGMENILAISMRCYGIVTALALLIGVVCYQFLDQIFARNMTLGELIEAKEIFLLLLLNIVISLSTMVFRSVINACERFLFLKGLETIQLVTQPIFVVLLLQRHPIAFTVAAVQTALNLGLSLSRLLYCKVVLKVRIQFHAWDRELFREFKNLALSVFVVTLIDQVFWKTNQIILGIVAGTGAVAVYSLASIIYLAYMALSGAISGVYLPYVTGMVARREPVSALSRLFCQIGRWQYYLLALVATGFIIFGRQFICLWAGEGFLDAYWITILIILPFTIDLIQNVGLSILQAMNRYDFRARVYFCTGLLNLFLAIPLAIRFGGIGCAFATGLSMFLGNGVVMNWFYKKHIGLDIPGFWRQIGRITIPVLLCLGLGVAFNEWIAGTGKMLFVGKVLGYTFLYGVVIYRLAMNEEEKEKIRGIVEKVRR